MLGPPLLGWVASGFGFSALWPQCLPCKKEMVSGHPGGVKARLCEITPMCTTPSARKFAQEVLAAALES